MGHLWNDVKHALHTLRKSRTFTLVAVATLALGIGANTAIFSIVNGVLLKPLSYPSADRIVQCVSLPNGDDAKNTSIPKFHEWQRQGSLFQEVAAFDHTGPGFNISLSRGGDRPEQVHGIHVTEGYFRLFGAPVILGRTFTQAEDLPHGGNVVVISYDLWQRKFGGDPKATGKLLWIGSDPYNVVGVLGKNFVSDPDAKLWIPFQLEHADTNKNPFFQVAGLLRPEISLEQANAQLRITAARFNHTSAATQLYQSDFAVVPLRDSIIGDANRSLLLLWAAVSFVLLIACTNMANLLLVRATGRRREFAIRSALGAGRWRIIRQLLAESVLLSLAGGALGTLLSVVGVHALLAASPSALPRVGQGSAVGLDVDVLLFTLALSLITGLLFGLAPAWSASRADLTGALKEGTAAAGTGLGQRRVRSLFIVSEVALALVLLIGSVLLIRTSVALARVDSGFDSHRVLTLEMSLNGKRYQKTAGVAQLIEEGRRQIGAIPGVESSVAVFWLPQDVVDGLPLEIVGRPQQDGGSTWMSASAGYLSVFHIPLLAGRDINDRDVAGAPPVVLINQALAKGYFPKQNPIGQHLLIGQGMGPELVEPAREIVGIFSDTHNHGLDRRPSPMVMVPIAQVTDGYTESYTDFQPLIWAVRTQSDPHQVIAAVSKQLRLASGGLLVSHVRTMDNVMETSTARQSFILLLFLIFGGVALFLAAIGIYGVMAYSVAQRTREIGTRMALGADRSAIRHLVVWHGMKLAIAGAVVGIGAAFALAHLIAGFLFGVRPWDPTAFLLAPLVLTAVALGAVWLPATRAARVDPIKALRAE